MRKTREGRMDVEEKTLKERQLILQIAIQETFRKRGECQREVDRLENELSIMHADGCSLEEKDKLVESMLYLQECCDGWQKTIDEIRDWQDELKA